MTAGRSGSVKMLQTGEPPLAKKARKKQARGKVTATTRLTEIMKPCVWKEFPRDLYETVIARLPITTFFRFRSVCKDWNSLLTSQSYSQQCAQVKQTCQPWIYATIPGKANDGAIYDPQSKKWYHPPVPALLTELIVEPVASAGGLVCFLDSEYLTSYVCNPVMASFKELPARSVDFGAIGMTVDASSPNAGYKIVCISCDGEYEIYDSAKNSWGCPGSLPTNIKRPLNLNIKSQAVSIEGTLYFMHSNPDGIVCYNMMIEVWKQILIPAPLHLSDYTVAECGGKLMLVGLENNIAMTCISVWELQKMTLLWKLVDRMPTQFCLDFYGKPVELDFLANKGLVMMSLRSKRKYRLITYDLSSKEWFKTARKIPSYGRKRPWLVNGTAFHPCSTDLV
ncbi:F-box only 6-like isoform X2 [Olea europaea subsp. europaea]|uniref:F-box only 6-like isoform X2 n=1 Tax=Olea europaea subsp. europaea TaxID=158383 RepID=A0A8S0QCV3_OLEEU|nr:F-box only 6-like isoform X2 [Olea europaea subsp. europaea]